jgi:hypothetical protein
MTTLVRPPFPKAIDSSIRASFTECPKKAYWQYIRHLARKGGSVHLVAGGAFARGCEVFRKNFYDHQASFDEALSLALVAATAEYGDYDPGFDHAKRLERVLEALIHYFTAFPPATDYIQPLKVSDHHAIEFSFGLPLPIEHPETGDPIIYCGRNDMLAVYNEQVFVHDDKTTSQLGASWANSWGLRGQIDGYIWAAQQFGYKPAGAVIRGISFLKKGFGTAESLQMRSQWQIDRWYDQVCRDIERMKDSWEKGAFDLALGTACTSYGGCSYTKLCTVAEPENWIEGDYEVRVWDPMALAAGASE